MSSENVSTQLQASSPGAGIDGHPVRKAYSPPRLRSLGRLTQITAGSTGGSRPKPHG